MTLILNGAKYEAKLTADHAGSSSRDPILVLENGTRALGRAEIALGWALLEATHEEKTALNRARYYIPSWDGTVR